MAEVEMRIEGFDELQARLKELGTVVADRILNKGMRAGAVVFQAAEEERAPERPDLPSDTALPVGALKRDVTIKKRRGQKVWIVRPGKYTSKAAYLVEYGHRLVRGGKNRLKKDGTIVGDGQVVGMVPPHAYIRPAYEASVRTALDAAAESIQADVSRLEYKGVRKAGL